MSIPHQSKAVKEILKDKNEGFTPSEKRLAAIWMQDYPLACLKSITELASAADVSTPTVIRMARKMGFKGFPDMQAALRREMTSQIQSPATKTNLMDQSDSHPIDQFSEAIISNLEHTVNRLDRDQFDKVAMLLSDEKISVYLAGGRITRSVADYFFNHLQIIRQKVTLLSQSPNVWPQYLLDMDHNSALVLFDIRRYEQELHKLAQIAHERGTKIILFTDQWGSNIDKYADHCFNVHVQAPSSWDSSVGLMFVVEALIADIQKLIGAHSLERIEELEAMFNTTRLFRKLK